MSTPTPNTINANPPMDNRAASKRPLDRKFLLVWFDELRGIRLNGDNAEKVADWIGPNAHVMESKKGDSQVKLVRVETNRGELLMWPGDYATRDRDGRIKIVRIDEEV